MVYTSTVLKEFLQNLNTNRDEIVLESNRGPKFSRGEVKNSVEKVAHYLQQSGVEYGDRVLFLGRPNVESIIYILGVIRAGGVLVLADSHMGSENFKGRVAFSQPKFVLIDPLLNKIESIPFLEQGLRVISNYIPPSEGWRGLKKIPIHSVDAIPTYEEDTLSEKSVDEEDEAIIIFTSGSTSVPKGVVHTYQSLNEMIQAIRSIVSVDSDDVFYSSQLHFLLAALITGSKVVLSESEKFDPATFIQDLRRYQVTKTFGIPAEYQQTYEYCKRHSIGIPSSLNLILLGSAPVLKGFLLKLNEVVDCSTQVVCVYGATEMLPIAWIDMQEKLTYEGQGDLLGKPLEEITLKIEDQEIVASGKNMAPNYLGSEKRSFYYTGDLGYLDHEKRLVLSGRKKDMIIRGNHNIYPSIFESTISRIPGVLNNAIVGVYDSRIEDEKIILFVEPESDYDQASLKQELISFLKDGQYSIDKEALPDVILVQELPVSGRTQKVDKEKLRSIAIRYI